LLDKHQVLIDTCSKDKNRNIKKYQAEYKTLFDSCGLKGNYDKLMKYSDLSNENDLRRLREHILERESDEALYDYQKVNYIIAMNRFISNK
jgi:hypothetical protein